MGVSSCGDAGFGVGRAGLMKPFSRFGVVGEVGVVTLTLIFVGESCPLVIWTFFLGLDESSTSSSTVLDVRFDFDDGDSGISCLLADLTLPPLLFGVP